MPQSEIKVEKRDNVPLKTRRLYTRKFPWFVRVGKRGFIGCLTREQARELSRELKGYENV